METGLQTVNQQRKLSEWAERVSECRNSGLSVKTWCRENGVSEQTYYKWQRRLYELAQNQAENRFVEITPQAKSRSDIAVYHRAVYRQEAVHALCVAVLHPGGGGLRGRGSQDLQWLCCHAGAVPGQRSGGDDLHVVYRSGCRAGFHAQEVPLQHGINTAVAIGLLILCIVLGMLLPMYVSTANWHLIVFVYIAVASIVPVWALLQPSDYLNSYLLVAMIVAAVVGVFVANPEMNLSAFSGFKVGDDHLFPILFVTIACGAVSGFHALVSSGTASKQIQNEKHMLPVSFGAMLMESLLAVVALIAVGAVSNGAQVAEGAPAVVFASAISSFLGKIGIPEDMAYTLITLSVSAFALTSLDSVARVGRLSFQEFFLDSTVDEKNMGPVLKFLTNKYTAAFITLAMAYALAKVGYNNIWPLFGSANQLLSALALIACAVFLKKTNRKGWMLWVPMGVMLAVTLTALGMTIVGKFGGVFAGTTTNLGGDLLQGSFAVALFVLGVLVAVQGVQKLFGKKQ